MSDCLFCKFVSGELETGKVYEDEHVLGFKDIYPQAKEHYLFIAKEHTQNINELVSKNPEDIARVYQAISKFTQEKKLDQSGFRVVTNLGKHGGQTIFHTHFHVLGGEQLSHFGS